MRKNHTLHHGNRKYSFNQFFFETIDTEAKAYWLGFIMADGGIDTTGRSKQLFIKLKLDDIFHLEKFKKALDSNHPIKISSSLVFGGKFYSAKIRICSYKLVDDLAKYKIIQNKTDKIRFPDIRSDLINHFIRGYFDGDGSISIVKSTNQKQINIIGKNYEFIKDFQHYLTKNCDINLLKINKTKNLFKISYGGNINIEKIGNFLYNNASIYLERKKYLFDLNIKN
jgi:hypothetical protein